MKLHERVCGVFSGAFDKNYMSISQEQVEHIAELSRIRLTPEEISQFKQELSGILDFVQKLEEVNTHNVKPATGGTDLTNEMREDEQDRTLEGRREALLAEVSNNELGYVKVKSVFN